MSKLNRIAIPIHLEDAPANNWELVREHDGLTKRSVGIIWIEWNEEGRFKAKHDKPALGRSLIMSPFNDFFTWQTTAVTEIVEERDDYVKFHTKNSTYELRRLYDAATGNPV
jgi:hypothetical protein